jgi:hypothetical protein
VRLFQRSQLAYELIVAIEHLLTPAKASLQIFILACLNIRIPAESHITHMGQDNHPVFSQMYIGLQCICTDIYCASECPHCVLGKLCLVTPMGNGLWSSIPRDIFPRVCECGYIRISMYPFGHVDIDFLPLGKSFLGPSKGCSTILSSCFVNPTKAGGTPTTIFSMMGVCASSAISNSCSIMTGHYSNADLSRWPRIPRKTGLGANGDGPFGIKLHG